MKSIGKQVVAALLLAAVPRCAWAGPAEVGPRPEAALVVVVGRSFDGLQAGNGFIVGDGTRVVTCEHIVFEKSASGRHRMETFVGVYSPYLGEACDGRIVAADEELDLAVLEVPWQGHPALALADANGVLSARRGRVIGLSATVHRIGQWNAGSSEEDGFRVDEEERPISFVGVRREEPRVVALDGIGQLGHGWSGSPILRAGTATAIGCFSRISKMNVGQGLVMREEAKGPAVSQVPVLLGLAPDDARLQPARTWLASPEDAHAACSLALRAASLLQPGRHEAALEPARAFVERRPDSALAHKMLASACEHADQVEAARKHYRRTLELDPDGLNTQLLYAQFLGTHGEPNAARQILEPLWRSGRSHDLVAISLVNLLGRQEEMDRCLEILDEAVRTHPRNVYLWQQKAACRLQTQGPAAALEPVKRMVELYPERGPFRAGLAQLQEKVGALGEAETNFRKLLEIEPWNPVVHYWLAEFLSRHRPQAGREALEVAQKALELPARGSLSKEQIEKLIQRIRGQMAPTAEK
jgi:tetratricopeptide (TPR) repeat protein